MRLNAGSVGRILQHFNSGEKFCCIASDNWKDLEKDLEVNGWGFIDMVGQWTDNTGKVWKERSYFVPDMLLEEAIQMGRLHHQLTIIWGENAKWYLYDMKGLVEARGDDFDVISVNDGMAQDFSLVPKQPERGFAFAASKLTEFLLGPLSAALTPPDGMVMALGESEYYVTMTLFPKSMKITDFNVNNEIGHIQCCKADGYYFVNSAFAPHGYGAWLYLAIIQYITNKYGLPVASDDRGATRDAATAVWDRLYADSGTYVKRVEVRDVHFVYNVGSGNWGYMMTTPNHVDYEKYVDPKLSRLLEDYLRDHQG
jgi:hypothetical protein